MPKLLYALPAALVLGACTEPPVVDVKERWSRAVVSYSFVPLYPPRGGVEIGDIRIHRIKERAATLDSRILYKAQDTTISFAEQKEEVAILPGIETFRLNKLNGDKILPQSFLRDLFGVNFESSASLSLSLTGLTTAELADIDVVGGFLDFLDERKNTDKFKRGLCASAITLGSGNLDDISISIVTRVIRASGVEYFASNGFSTVPGASREPDKTDGAATPVTQSDGVETTSRSGLRLEKLTLDKPITIGVDALSILPAKLYRTNSKNLRKLCDDPRFNRVEPARLDDLRKSLGIKVN